MFYQDLQPDECESKELIQIVSGGRVTTAKKWVWG